MKVLLKHLRKKIEELEKEKALLTEKKNFLNKPIYDFGTAVKYAIGFIKNLILMWKNGDLQEKRLLMDLAFKHKIPYEHKNGFGTAEFLLPLKVYTLSKSNNSHLVEMPGVEPGSTKVWNKFLQS